MRGSFTFLNQTVQMGEVDWRTPGPSRLWTYNLHYFGYAADIAWAHRLTGDVAFLRRIEALAATWIEQTADGTGTAWEPYTLSLRIVNWIHWLLIAGEGVEPDIRRRVHVSLHRQLRCLSSRIEWHILANHVLENLFALVAGGLLFDGTAARDWLSRGTRLLERELRVQVNLDGGHFERSPMYHALLTARVLETAALLNACGHTAADAVAEVGERMLAALRLLRRLDGTLHLINDSANNVAPALCSIAARSPRVVAAPSITHRVWSMPPSAFYGFRDDANGESLIIDAGAPSPSFQPGHAHCGLLSYELELNGRPVIVDSGVHGYDGDSYREYSRSTRAHNTVMIDDREQNEMWGVFRIARRAEVRRTSLGTAAETFHFEAAYSPYFDNKIVHVRRFVRDENGWTITDVVEGAHRRPLASFVHFHPGFALAMNGDVCIATDRRGAVHIRLAGFDQVDVVRAGSSPLQAWYLPEFGRALPAPLLMASIYHNRGQPFGVNIRWERHAS